jgi:hypothetical protein
MMSKPKSEQDLLRIAFRDYWRARREQSDIPGWRWTEDFPPVSEAFADLTCGAKTRAGTPCKQIALYWSGRCKFHGGLSTGPKTEVGKAKARENGKLGGRGHIRKPKPMEISRKQQGCELLGEGIGGLAEAKSREVDRVQFGPANSPSRVVEAGDPEKTAAAAVQCRECGNLSAGYTCLAPGSGLRKPALGEWRVCAHFLRGD